MLNESYTSCLIRVKSTFALQKVLTSQFQELVVSMLLNIFGRRYIWKGYPHFWLLLLIPLCTELLPEISVTRGNKGYTGGIAQLSVITGLFSMTATPLPLSIPKQSQPTGQPMLNAISAVERGVAAEFIPDYENFQETSANPQPLFSWVLFSLLCCS